MPINIAATKRRYGAEMPSVFSVGRQNAMSRSMRARNCVLSPPQALAVESGRAGALRRLPEQLASVLSGRAVEPALAGAEEAALVGEAEHVGGLGQRQVEPAKILLGELAPRVVQQLHKRRCFLVKAPLQRALAHAQLAGDLIAPRLAVRQAADDHFARPVADQGVV